MHYEEEEVVSLSKFYDQTTENTTICRLTDIN